MWAHHSRPCEKAKCSSLDACPKIVVAINVGLLAKPVRGRDVRVDYHFEVNRDEGETHLNDAPSPAALALHMSLALKQSDPLG